MCGCNCNNNLDKHDALQQVIDELRNEPGCLMPIMQRAQDIYGYLPEEVMNHIAKELDIPVSDIYGVATFYAQFNLEPTFTIDVKEKSVRALFDAIAGRG